jgi:hypothetical protein
VGLSCRQRTGLNLSWVSSFCRCTNFRRPNFSKKIIIVDAP